MPSPTRAATPPPDQKTLDANRTEIIVLAIAILFLVSQLILIIWLFAPRAFPRRPRKQRIIEWMPVQPGSTAQESIFSNEDDGRLAHRRNHRRSSSWNGGSAATSQAGHPVRRRRSSGLKPADSRTLSVSDQDSDLSDRDCSVRDGLRDAGLAAASLAIPIIPLSSPRLRSPSNSPELEPESDGSDGRVREMGAFPAKFSPRSPRVGPMNVATMSAILKGTQRKVGTTAVTLPVTDARDMTSRFDDPLGVTRRKSLFGNDNTV
ncbi:hypothetical protein N0V82_008453 [Gnomoniopsis sp. IMI 355080]|nr:hypothetical protein N0V82_008453 [Gnomoniopsis sp. IMI 355080]